MAQEYASVDLSRAQWHKSTHSNGGEGGCIEVADHLSGVIAVRDSKDPDGPNLMFAPTVWRSFIEGVKRQPSKP